MRSVKVPDEVKVPCCTYFRAHVECGDGFLIRQVAKQAAMIHGWKFHVLRDELDRRKFHLYISGKTLTGDELNAMKHQMGPTLELKRIMEDMMDAEED